MFLGCFSACLLFRHDLRKICQELQLAPLADQLATELGADSEGGIHFNQFLSWYKTALEDATAASSRASSSPDTPSSNCEVVGSDDEVGLLDTQLTWGVWPGAADKLASSLQQPGKKGGGLRALQSTDKAAKELDADKASRTNETARREVQDLIASIDINTTDLSELATKVSQCSEVFTTMIRCIVNIGACGDEPEL